jgi:hypothetical protein
MTATTGDSGHGPDYSQYRPWAAWLHRHTRWVPPALMWAGHYCLWFAIPFIVLILADDGAGRPVGLTGAVTAGWFVFIAAIITDRNYHAPRLCERCMGAAPLDPQAAVERWRPALRADHNQRLMFTLLAANLIWIIGTQNLLVNGIRAAGLPAHHDVWAYCLQDIPSLIIMVAYFIAVRIHRDLYPWCPWCHWGDGGGPEETAPVPDPEDHGARNPSLSETPRSLPGWAGSAGSCGNWAASTGAAGISG